MRAVMGTLCLLVAVAVSVSACGQRTTFQLVGPGKKLTVKDVKSLAGCKFVYSLKAGMTNAEANDAIDAGFNKFITCMNARAVKAQASS